MVAVVVLKETFYALLVVRIGVNKKKNMTNESVLSENLGNSIKEGFYVLFFNCGKVSNKISVKIYIIG